MISKRCLRCARPFSDRRKYADFDAVHYCSRGCRGRRFSGTHRQIAVQLLALLEARGPHKTLCPSEVARLVAPDDWRPLMPAVRQVAEAFAEHGEVALTHRGQAVDLEAHQGPIRVGWVTRR